MMWKIESKMKLKGQWVNMNIKQFLESNNIGEVIDCNSLIKMIYDNNLNYNINPNDDFLFVITNNPKKIITKLSFDKI